MDANRVDALFRSLTAAGYRRAALATALGGVLALLGREDADAHNPLRKCEKTEDGEQRDRAIFPGSAPRAATAGVLTTADASVRYQVRMSGTSEPGHTGAPVGSITRNPA